MSAIAGVFGPAAGSSGPAVRNMIATMRNRATGPADEFVADGICLQAARHPWEAQLNGWSGPSIAADEHWVVAADATLYYLDDLRRRLTRAPAAATTAQLLLQALHQWGPRFAEFVEGDYAIVAWERETRRVLLARDFAGRRNLVYSQVGDSLVVASSPTAVLAHGAVSTEYDSAFIALSASGAIAHGPRTAFRNILAVPGGSTLAFDGRRIYQVARWQPPPAGSGWEPLSDDAAEELRALLIGATRERLAPSGPTTVFMSGGWDSTSVFGAGMASVVATKQRSLVPVSLSLPADDWGYEDDHIRAVGEHWSVPINWMPFDSVPLMTDSDRRAEMRDDPLVQVYESMMRSLSQRSIEHGSRVALDGFGGDHLFLSSGGAMLADHLFYGRWSTMWEWWKAGRVARDFIRDMLLPHLSPSVREWIGSVRGRPLRGYWTRSLPDWIRQTPEIIRELEPEFERHPDEGAAEFELRYIVSGSLVPRAVAWNHALGLEEGVEMRGPLFDRRVIEFATRRPISERSSGGDGKRLLRAAMKGLLPDSVLAARPRKTGTTAGYFRRQFQGTAPREIARWFDGRSSILAQMGILDSGKVLAACRYYEQTGDHGIGSQLYLTLEAERWLAVRQPGP